MDVKINFNVSLQFTNDSGHKVPACYLDLHEESEVETSTCIMAKIQGYDSHFEESYD